MEVIAVVPLILLGMSSAPVPDTATAQGIVGIRSAVDLLAPARPARPVAPAPGLLTAASTAVRQPQAVDDPVGNGIAIAAAMGAGAGALIGWLMDRLHESPAQRVHAAPVFSGKRKGIAVALSL